MKVWKKKLQNPFVLVAQGFFLGGLLFWTTQGEASRPTAAPAAAAHSAPASH